jgi:hypothetical protein
MATVLTMSSTSAPRDRSFTGLLRPCSTGPIAIASAVRCNALYGVMRNQVAFLEAQQIHPCEYVVIAKSDRLTAIIHWARLAKGA